MAKLADFERQLRRLGGELERKGLEEIQIAIGTEARRLVDVAVRSTPVKTAGRSLRDADMSGFKSKGNVRPIEARYKLQGSTISVRPGGNSAGRMSILESGRSAYTAGDQRVYKRYKSKKTGEVSLRTRAVKRTVGAQPGKGTWTRASSEIRDRYLIVAGETLHKILIRTFTVR